MNNTRRAGLILVLLGAAGLLFFWATDPRYGLGGRWGAAENVVDAANEALVGTAVGLAGSVAVLLIGVWLATRRAA